METTIRRLNDHIYTLGTGVIAFAAWTLLKFTLYCTVYQNVLVEEMRVDLPADSSVLQVTIIAVWIIVFLDALFQCLIGFSARADGKGGFCFSFPSCLRRRRASSPFRRACSTPSLRCLSTAPRW